MRYSSKDFIHPEDKAARDKLESIPGFATVLKAVMKMAPEQLLHGINMAQKIRLGERQLPELYGLLPPACEELGIDEPELYLEMDPTPNAYTYGETKVFVTVTSGLVEHLATDELAAVLAHECGHIVCSHVIYHTMADVLLGAGAALLGPVALVAKPIRLALLYWRRRSELSADRAAAAATGDPDLVVSTMVRLAGGPKAITGGVNMDLYLAQAEEYDRLLDSAWDKALQGLAVMNRAHPFLAVRAREIKRWAATDDWRRLRAAASGQDASGGESGSESRSASGDASGGTCTACGGAVREGWNFCRSCGARLGREDACTGGGQA